MKAVFSLFALLCLACTVIQAQKSPTGPFSEWKLYGGYQYTALDSHAVQEALNLEHQIDPAFPLLNFGNRQNLNGWDAGLQNDITKWFGVVIDVSGSYGEKRILVPPPGDINVSTRTRMSFYTFMGGPQFTFYRGSRFQPFARFLLGGGFFNSSTDILANNVPQIAPFHANDSGFAYGGGAGSDIFFSRLFAFRIAGDLIRSRLFGDTQNHLRAAAGLVYRF